MKHPCFRLSTVHGSLVAVASRQSAYTQCPAAVLALGATNFPVPDTLFDLDGGSRQVQLLPLEAQDEVGRDGHHPV